MLSPRAKQEEREAQFLSPLACQSAHSQGRHRPDEPCSVRTDFQRDIDRIVHSKSFRRLKHKTQVFLLPEGDHYRTRMTHTIEVSRIARTIARGLSLNEDLTEAIALGHDLGHAPYGHAGEFVLNTKMEGVGFRHNVQSLRVVSKLENHGDGLNLCYEVENGILCHTGSTKADTLEGRIVAIADRIAYINHDIEDALRADILSPIDLPFSSTRALGHDSRARIAKMTEDIIYASMDKDDILQSDEVGSEMLALRQFMFEHVYTNQSAKHEEIKAKKMVAYLFDYYKNDSDLLPPDYQHIIAAEGLERGVCDYIAGMSDSYAAAEFSSIFVPKGWQTR
ncbi:MAG: deoxyguanosinetriphosphate triphosphohydrolase [Eubacteriales bacterium]